MPAALLLKADKKAELKAKQICSSGPLVAWALALRRRKLEKLFFKKGREATGKINIKHRPLFQVEVL